MLGHIDAIFKSEGLRAVDNKREELTKAAGNVAFQLARIAQTGGMLTEDVRVRDSAAEIERDRRETSADASAEPIFKFERRVIGPLEGAALVRTNDDCRARLVELQRCLRAALAAARAGTDELSLSALKKTVQGTEAAHAAALELIPPYRASSSFFSPSNVDRLEQWAAGFSAFSISQGDVGLVLVDGGKRTVVRPLASVQIPDLPPLYGD